MCLIECLRLLYERFVVYMLNCLLVNIIIYRKRLMNFLVMIDVIWLLIVIHCVLIGLTVHYISLTVLNIV